MARLEQGKGTDEDIEKIVDISANMFGRSFCALGDSLISPIHASVKYFRDEYIEHFDSGGCPFDPAASTAWAGAAV
jgi:NADH-quinone oxidoreductase subunit F